MIGGQLPGDAGLSRVLMAMRSGITTGRDWHPLERAYLRRCTHFHWRTGTIVMLTRDTGHHSSGWFKNPDFERCRHLSLSFRQPLPARPADELGDVHRLGRMFRESQSYIALRPFDRDLATHWVRLVHGDDARHCWTEPAFSREGRELEVMHYRVFCDQNWEAITPRGEVYSRELTEAGWQSWSDQQGPVKNWVDAE